HPRLRRRPARHRPGRLPDGAHRVLCHPPPGRGMDVPIPRRRPPLHPSPTRPVMTITTAGAVKGGPPDRPEGTAAKRRPLTAPITQHLTISIVPPRWGGTYTYQPAPPSAVQMTLYPLTTPG